MITLNDQEILRRKFLSEQAQEMSRMGQKSEDYDQFFRLPWYLLKVKTRRSSMLCFRSLVKELAVRAVFFPDD